MANIKILKQALRAIKKYPQFHDQETWTTTREDNFPVKASNGATPPCGTTMCLAGWIAFQNAPRGTVMAQGGYLYKTLPQGGFEYIDAAENMGREFAELTESQAEALFYRAQTVDDLAAMINHLATDPDAHGYALRQARDAALLASA